MFSCTSKEQTGKIKESPIEKTPLDTLDIYLREFDVSFSPENCVGKQRVELNDDTGYVSVDLYDCKGRMKFSQFNKAGILQVEGFYVNSIDTLKKYSMARSAVNGSKRLFIYKYFEPLADSTWTYYENGKPSTKKVFHGGILVDPKE
jgi:hypothetical protein